MPDFELPSEPPTLSAEPMVPAESGLAATPTVSNRAADNSGDRPTRHPSFLDSNPDSLELEQVAPIKALQDLVIHLNRERLKVQELMSSLSFALRSFNNINQILELVPLVTSRLTDADGAALLLFARGDSGKIARLYCNHTEAQCSRLRSALEGNDEALPAHLALSQPFPSRTPIDAAPMDDEAQEHGIAGEASMDRLDHRVKQLIGDEQQVFAIPLLSRQVVRGRLYVFASQPDFTWTEERQALTRLVADQTAVAIENNDLTSELEQRAKLAQEIAVGSEIQMRLQPAHCPDISGLDIAAHSESASPVGGDYYDFIAIPYSPCEASGLESTQQQSWGIAIGDVMGKGVPAGLLMMATRGVLRAEVPHAREPGQILQHLNHVIFSDMDTSNRFVTLFYSDYCPISRQLRFSNAAHNPRLWWQAATGIVQRLDTEGMLIGLEQGSTYDQRSVQLGLGDVVIYYTDGVTEAANPNGDRFEEQGLITALKGAAQQCDRPQEILDNIFKQVRTFRQGGGQEGSVDDMTAIVLKVRANGGDE